MHKFWEIERLLLNKTGLNETDFQNLLQTAGQEETPNSPEYEFYCYIAPMHHHHETAEIFYKSFCQYSTLFCLKTNKENSVYLSLLNIISCFKPQSRPDEVLSSYMALWTLHALYSTAITNVCVENGVIWRSRYEIINAVKMSLKNWLLCCSIVLNQNITISVEVRNLIWVLIQNLIHSGVLDTKLRYLESQKTEVFIRGLEFISAPPSFSVLKFLLQPPKLMSINKQLYIYKQHYSTMQPAVRRNTASKKSPVVKDLSFLTARMNLKLYGRAEVFKLISTYLEYNYTVDFKNIESITSKLKALKLTLWLDSKKKLFMPYYNLQLWWVLQKNFDLWSSGFYFEYFIDFRGRGYANSLLSYTFNKLTRNILTYGSYTEEELQDFKATPHTLKASSLHLIYTNTALLQKYPNLRPDCPVHKYYVYTLFIELGKLSKAALSELHLGRVSEQIFLQAGILLFNKFEFGDLTNKQWPEIVALLAVFDNLNKGEYPKIPVFKDATASAIQLLMVLLGASNDVFLAECNLTDTEFWYDTYLCIINKFLHTHNVDTALRESYFTRAALKQTIMTYNYQATFYTCWKEFLEHHGLSHKCDTELKRKLLHHFKDFYKFLQELFNSNLYFQYNSNILLKWFKTAELDNYEYTTLDDISVPLSYFKADKQRIERFVLEKRSTIVWTNLKNEVDELKTFRALRANLIHSFDGYLIRRVEQRFGRSIITIHDSYGIDILSIEKLLEIVQDELTTLFRLNLFSVTKPQSSMRSPQINSRFVLL